MLHLNTFCIWQMIDTLRFTLGEIRQYVKVIIKWFTFYINQGQIMEVVDFKYDTISDDDILRGYRVRN